MNNWFMVQPIIKITLELVKGWSPYVQDIELALKETRSLRTLEVGKGKFHFGLYVPRYQLSFIPKMGGLLGQHR